MGDSPSSVIMTGAGGQGVQLCAKVLALAAASEGRHVMLSSYFGGEMRGGRTEATVVIGEEPLTGMPPIVPRLDAAIVLHPKFLDMTIPRLAPDPLVVADAWAWTDDADDVAVGTLLAIPASDLAADLGAPVAAGLILLGAYAGHVGTPGQDALADAVREIVPPHRTEVLDVDLAALRAGAECASELREATP